MIAASTFTPTPPVAEAQEWLVRADEDVAHAFATTGGAGWMWSRCRRIRLQANLKDAGEVVRCSECELLVDGAPGEISEAYGR